MGRSTVKKANHRKRLCRFLSFGKRLCRFLSFGKRLCRFLSFGKRLRQLHSFGNRHTYQLRLPYKKKGCLHAGATFLLIIKCLLHHTKQIKTQRLHLFRPNRWQPLRKSGYGCISYPTSQWVHRRATTSCRDCRADSRW
jgi:hypothetical protein